MGEGRFLILVDTLSASAMMFVGGQLNRGVDMTQDLPREDADSTPETKVHQLHPASPPGRPRATHILPTNRIALSKQLDVLRTFAIVSGQSERPVKVVDVAKIVGLNPSTIQLMLPWVVDVRLLTRSEGGYLPSPEVFAFNHAHTWNAESAPRKLAPVLAQGWFAQALLPRIAFKPVDEQQGVQILAEASTAPPEARSQLSVLLDWITVAGLIAREGGQIRPIQGAGQVTEDDAQTAEPPRSTTEPREQPVRGVSTSFVRDSAEGVVQFNVSVRVNLSEFGGWRADRIAAFFNGIAAVLAAKSGIEQQEGTDSGE